MTTGTQVNLPVGTIVARMWWWMKASLGCWLVATIFGVMCGRLVAQAAAAVPDGEALLKAGKFLEACEAYEAVLARDPTNTAAEEGEVDASERLALQERSAGRRDDALKALLQARQYVPGNRRLLYDLGVLEDEMRLFVDADRTLTQLKRLGPLGPDELYAAARVKLDVGQLDAAEEKMLAYLKVRPRDASAHYGLGRVYRQGLQFEKARAEFQRSIELQPRQTEGYYELGDAELAAGDMSAAMENFAKTLQRDPHHAGALTDEGIVYFKSKQYEKAEAVLRESIRAAADYQPSHYYLGLTLGRMGQQEESKRELETAAKMAERDSKLGAGLRLQVPEP